MNPVRIAVIGTGVMGSYHLKNYAKMDDVELVGVYDVDIERARAKAAEVGTTAFDDLDELIKHVDAVSIVTPTTTHFEVAKKFLSAGIPCLIEKPLATTKKDCQALIDLAKENGTFFIVGHVERFNPAIRALASILKREKPEIYEIRATRINEASGRINDVAVTTDLMIHDLDIVLALIDSPTEIIKAEGDKDEAKATVVFRNGAAAKLLASRKTKDKVRTLELVTSLGIFSLDYVAQTLTLAGKDIPVNKGFSLEGELKHFVACVKKNETPAVTGEIALKALEVMWDIEKLLPL
jgi:predicted dehydrogenase